MRVFNSIVAIVFCDSRCLSDLTPVNIGTCYLLGHSYRGWWIQWWQWLWLMEGPEFNGDNFFCNSWRLSILTCYLLDHSFRPKTANAPVLMKFCTVHETRVVNQWFQYWRMQWVPQRTKTEKLESKKKSCVKIQLLLYKQNW